MARLYNLYGLPHPEEDLMDYMGAVDESYVYGKKIEAISSPNNFSQV